MEHNNFLICNSCKSNDIIKSEIFTELVYYDYKTDYEGNTLEAIDRTAEKQDDMVISFTCNNCGNFDEDIHIFHDENQCKWVNGGWQH